MLRIAAAAVALMFLFALTWQLTNDRGHNQHRFFGADRKVER